MKLNCCNCVKRPESIGNGEYQFRINDTSENPPSNQTLKEVLSSVFSKRSIVISAEKRRLSFCDNCKLSFKTFLDFRNEFLRLTNRNSRIGSICQNEASIKEKILRLCSVKIIKRNTAKIAEKKTKQPSHCSTQSNTESSSKNPVSSAFISDSNFTSIASKKKGKNVGNYPEKMVDTSINFVNSETCTERKNLEELQEDCENVAFIENGEAMDLERQTIYKFQCDNCPKKFRSKLGFSRHCNLKHPKPFQCNYCDASLKGILSVRNHLISCHKDTNEAIAAKANKIYFEEREKFLKKEIEWKQKSCKKCGLLFRTSGQILAHQVWEHYGQRRCAVCSMDFGCSEHFLFHLDSNCHIENKCTRCCKTFRDNFDFLWHFRITKLHNPNSKDFTISCELCSKQFSLPHQLKAHYKWTHGGNSKKSSDVIDSKIQLRQQLKQCSHCSTDFKSKFDIAAHVVLCDPKTTLNNSPVNIEHVSDGKSAPNKNFSENATLENSSSNFIESVKKSKPTKNIKNLESDVRMGKFTKTPEGTIGKCKRIGKVKKCKINVVSGFNAAALSVICGIPTAITIH